jgi:hypothetical protein
MPAFSQVSNDNEDEVYKIDARVGKNAYVPGQVLLKFKDESPVKVSRTRGVFNSVDNNAVSAVLKEFGVNKMDKLLPNENPNRTLRKTRAFNGETIEEHDLSQLYLVEVDDAHAPQTMQLVDQLKLLDAVEYAEPNYKVYLTDSEIAGNFGGNPYTAQQWYLDEYGVKQLWNKPIINPKRPVIAILDTGVDMTHPDLKDNLWTNTSEAEGESGYDNDGNGFAGDVHGWDFINNTPNVRDFNMHGTHVAGIAAAANNDIGIIGANPMALIMPISVMQSDGTGDVATIVKGIDYAVKMGADVLNLSLGTYANSRAMRQALEKAYQTAVIVASAGNDGIGIYKAASYPAAYSFVLGVQATTKTGVLASFSNYDDDGNTFSSVTTLQDPDGFNYELKAPGTEILSTIPGGKYRVLQGTSMAAPLVAGAITALKMVKLYDTQEILWGDLLHTSNIAQAFAVTARPAELDLMKIMLRERKELNEETEEDYSGDGEVDAGETVSLFPVIRTTYGEASNIKIRLEMGDEFEDPDVVQILTDIVDFGWHLDAYGKGVSVNPLKLKVSDNIADGRHIKMKLVLTCDESNESIEKPFILVVNNMVKIGGIIDHDMTLTADHVYLVNSNLGVPQGVTLTIKPGTTIKFRGNTGISNSGIVIAEGKPDSLIRMIGYNDEKWKGLSGVNLKYCQLSNLDRTNSGDMGGKMENCIIDNSFAVSANFGNTLYKCNLVDSKFDWRTGSYSTNLCNIVNNSLVIWGQGDGLIDYSQMKNMNYFNNFGNAGDVVEASFGVFSSIPQIKKLDNPSYLGAINESVIRPHIYEIGNTTNTYGQADLSNILEQPIAEAHGIVWKVVVNGIDAQDGYEDLAPLGIGKHKFEVYFNRPMNKTKTPHVSFGVREPYTQNFVAEDGRWNEDGTIYTVYKTITGKTKSDGMNRIYVWGAEDDEFFECPYEKIRFNINLQAAGSMATGFAGEAKMGRVELTWNNENNNFEDAMGFNIYRFNPEEKRTIPAHYDENWRWIGETQVVDTICINKEIVDVETTSYIDYDVTPGRTYYYMYKVLSTDLKEYDVSNVIAVTPLTASLGDANGSGEVEVTDVITTVNYAAGMNPKPFIFEAADVNVDLAIDILDVVGIIQKVLNPTTGARAVTRADGEAVAIYTIEDGVLYVESPVALGGVQVQLNMSKMADVVVAEDLNGFEHTSSWLSDNDYQFMAYNLSGKTLPAGKHALLKISEAEISKLILSNTRGVVVPNKSGDGTTNIDAMGAKVMQQDGIFNLKGQKITGKVSDLEKLPKGVYIINGEKVVK